MDIYIGRRIYGDENGGAEMIDFSTVKGITIPEGAVKKITDSSGNVLWEGNITFYVKTSSNAKPDDVIVADKTYTAQ